MDYYGSFKLQMESTVSWIGLVFSTSIVCLLSVPARSEITFNKAHKGWTLVSRNVEYILTKQEDTVSFEYFGPVAHGAWMAAGPALNSPAARFDIDGQAEGQEITPSELKLVSEETVSSKPGVDELHLVFEHRHLPLRIKVNYTTWGDTGVITRALVLETSSMKALHVQRLPSLSWSLPPGEYDLTYLWGGWSQEWQVGNEMLGPGARKFVSASGRSTNNYAPWFCLHNHSNGTRYLAELAYSGNWEMGFARSPRVEEHPHTDGDLSVDLGMQFDFAGALALEPGQSFSLPVVAFTSSDAGLDEAANQMHRYQRKFVFAQNPTNDPPLVQFNSWYPFPGKMTVAEMKRCAELAAKLGAEVYVLDAGWYNKKDWSKELGDYYPDPVAFPNGIQELANYVRQLGMKFGIWVEIENVGVESDLFRQHPDWCLKYNGQPIMRGDRLQLDFSKPEVRQWARSVIDRFARDYGIQWLKIDYNIEVGNEFDPPATDTRRGDVLYKQIINYYAWLDEVRAAYPNLVIENCASGGLRFDSGIMAHTNTTWLSDEVRPKPSLQLAYGCTLQFTPGVCNHWMVGDTTDGRVMPTDSPEWWDFMLRVPMNGQFGISSKVFDWPPELLSHAAGNVALYKRIRSTIAAADVYHLTRQPAHNDPAGWMAIQYATPNGAASVVMAYRLQDSLSLQTFKLHGLNPTANYKVTNDGKEMDTMTGRELMEGGVSVILERPWSSVIIELHAGGLQASS
jgi:alpha-galactosidase